MLSDEPLSAKERAAAAGMLQTPSRAQSGSEASLTSSLDEWISPSSPQAFDDSPGTIAYVYHLGPRQIPAVGEPPGTCAEEHGSLSNWDVFPSDPTLAVQVYTSAVLW